MKIKLTKLPGSKTVNVSIDDAPSEMMDKEEMVIEVKKSVTICDNPLNICRCIVKVEKVED